MSGDPIKTGIVGLGRSGWSIHALGIAERVAVIAGDHDQPELRAA